MTNVSLQRSFTAVLVILILITAVIALMPVAVAYGWANPMLMIVLGAYARLALIVFVPLTVLYAGFTFRRQRLCGIGLLVSAGMMTLWAFLMMPQQRERLFLTVFAYRVENEIRSDLIAELKSNLQSEQKVASATSMTRAAFSKLYPNSRFRIISIPTDEESPAPMKRFFVVFGGVEYEWGVRFFDDPSISGGVTSIVAKRVLNSGLLCFVSLP